MIMIYASIKGTMDDLLPITGAGRADNINFLSNPTQDASLLRVLTLRTAPRGDDLLRTTALLWSAVPGRTYRVQTKVAMEETWRDLPGASWPPPTPLKPRTA
jgi:hypothetical protein